MTQACQTRSQRTKVRSNLSFRGWAYHGNGGGHEQPGERAGPAGHLQQPHHMGPQGQCQDQDGKVSQLNLQ